MIFERGLVIRMYSTVTYFRRAERAVGGIERPEFANER